MAGPGYCARNRWQISLNRRLFFVFSIIYFDFLNLCTVLLEKQVILVLKTTFERISMKNALEFAQKAERVHDVGDVSKVRVDILLKQGLNVRNINVEFYENAVKFIVGVV